MVADCILAKAEQSRTLRMLCTKDYGHTNSLQPTFKYQSHIQAVHRLHISLEPSPSAQISNITNELRLHQFLGTCSPQ